MKIHINPKNSNNKPQKNRRTYLDIMDEDNDEELRASFNRIFSVSSKVNDKDKKKTH